MEGQMNIFELMFGTWVSWPFYALMAVLLSYWVYEIWSRGRSQNRKLKTRCKLGGIFTK